MKPLSIFVFAVAAGLSFASLRAQGNELVVRQHVRTNRLSAVVADATGAVISGATISIFKCPAGEFMGLLHFVPIAEMVADRQGKFSFSWPSKRVCLQAKSLGMNFLQIEVQRDPKAGKLQVILVPGT